MRKAIAISLLSIHLFYIGGYKLLFTFLDNAADNRMISTLDNHAYSDGELLQLQIALNTPYILGSDRYERCDGEIEYNGIQYNYVKRMIRNDTLYLYCIPNMQKTAIDQYRNTFASRNATEPADNSRSGRDILKQINFSDEFQLSTCSFGFRQPQNLTTAVPTINHLALNGGFALKQLQPPDLFI